MQASFAASLHLRTAADLEPVQAAGFGGLPALMQGQVHEWFLANTWGTVRANTGKIKRGLWHPPLMVMGKLAGEAAIKGGKIVWIGRNCWPTLQVLCATSGKPVADAMNNSLFLDPLTDAERFWGIGQALRCAGVAAVVADGSGMDRTVSRRLQLAAESGKVLGLLARPAWELQESSWASTRWEVRPWAGNSMAPGWEIELKSCRGQHREQDAPRTWIAEWSYQVFRGTGALDISPGMGCGAVASPEGAARDPAAGETA